MIRDFCFVLKDPFGDVIKGIMNDIHGHAQQYPLCQPGTQNYEQWVVQAEQIGKTNMPEQDIFETPGSSSQTRSRLNLVDQK